MAFWTYMIRCADGSYYVGHTDDLERRMAQHDSGEVASHTARHLLVTLVWSEEFATREEAFAVERQVKGWSRAKKEAMIEGDWELVSRLALRNTSQPRQCIR